MASLLCQVCVDLMFKYHDERKKEGIPEEEILVPVANVAVTVRMVQWNGYPVNQLVCMPHFNYQEKTSGLATV